MRKITTWLLPLLLLFHFLHSSSAGAQQRDRPPDLNLGDAVVTGFSGTLPPNPSKLRPQNKSAIDLTFINPDGPSVRIVDVSRPGYVWDGRLFQAPKTFDVFAKDVGQVFGVALDDQATPNIYVAATSVFGLNIVRRGRDGLPERLKKGGPGAGWMKGQFGLDLQGGPGGIYKIDGRDGVATLFANVTLDGVPNPGPGLGNLVYDSAHKQLFVSDLYTGMIHRFGLDGRDLGSYNHGVTGLAVAKLATVPFDAKNRPNIASERFDTEKPDTWGFAPAARRVWGLAVHEGRLYYSVVSGPQIWSVGIERDGGFAADPRWELDVPAQAGPLPVSDIAFSQKGAMILAQRALIAGAYDYSAFTRPGEPQVFRIWLKGPNDPPSPGRWKLVPEEYAVGFAGNYRNTNGGVALGYGYGADGTLSANACEFSLWTTGQNLRNAPPLKTQLDPGGPLVVHGLAGVPASPVRNFNEPPWTSYAVDYDDAFRDPRAAGHLGSVRIYTTPCPASAVYSGPGYAANAPYISGGGGGVRWPPPPPNGCPPGTGPVGGKCVATIDLRVDKEDTPGGGGGHWFNVWVTNVGPPISFPAGGITVTENVPAGMTVTGVTGTGWSCAPPTIVGPGAMHCTYNLAGSLGTGAQLLSTLIVHYTTTGPGPFNNCATVGIGPSVGMDGNPSNDTACVTVTPTPGSLIVKKAIVYNGPILLPPQNYPVTVICGGTITILNLPSNGTPQTVSNIPLGTSCTIVEPTPPVPPNICPPGTTGVWSIAYAPPSPITITSVTTTVTVTNTLDCIKAGQVGSLDLEKVVATSGIPSQAYPVTVTCGGTITTLNLIDGVTQTVNNLTLGTSCTIVESPPPPPLNICPPGSTPVWSTSYIPPLPVIITGSSVTVMVRNTVGCSPIGGQVGSLMLRKSVTNSTAGSVAGLTYPATLSCVIGMSPATTSSITLVEGVPQTVNNIALGSVCTLIEILPTPPTTGCPAGQVPTWATPIYTPPAVTISGTISIMSVQNILNCAPKRKSKAAPLNCRAPAKPNRAGTVCVCPDRMTKKGNTCVEQERPPPGVSPAERQGPRASPGDVIRVLPGLIGPGRGGGGGGVAPGGGGGSPGKL